MNHKIYKYFLLLLSVLILTACGTYDTSPNKNSQSDTDKSPGLNYTAVSFSLTIDDKPGSRISSPLAGEDKTKFPPLQGEGNLNIPSPLAGEDKTKFPPLQGEGQGGDGVSYATSPRTLAKLDCTASSIATIEIAVYDSTGNELVKKSFNCNAHSGNIEVPSGGNRKFVFSGKNSSGVEVYRGERNNIDCQPGATYNIGEVTIGKLPSIPAGVTAIADDGKVTIVWSAVSGATSYNLYWSTNSGVTKNTGTKIATVISPYTHSGITNGTTYYYVITTVNSYGESSESSEIHAVPASSSITTNSIKLPRTGQTTCYDSSGNIIACAGTGQDGDLQKGIAWPTPRFTDNGDGTMTDSLTGLVWTKDANAPGPAACSPSSTKIWQAALDYVACLNSNSYLGYTDWRLPNVNELRSLAHDGQSDTATWLNSQGFNNVQGFNIVQSNYYWSSTSVAYITNYAWNIKMWYGSMGNSYKSFDGYVWPVRSGQSNLFGSSIIQLPITGQSTCYENSGNVIGCAGTGQDGELQRGVTWPSPRFIDNGDSTVTDNLTRLVWTKDGKVPGPSSCSPAVSKAWQAALDYVACLNANRYLGYTDWRLPNVNELRSLAHDGQSDTATWLNSQGFNSVQSIHYWSSTSNADYPDNAWVVNILHGYMVSFNKSDAYYVWPVRSE